MKVFSEFNSEVVSLLNASKVGIIPTDTIYGIVCELASKESVERIYKIKNRPVDKPVGTIIFGEQTQLKDIVNGRGMSIATKYWPGTSVILSVSESLKYADRGFHSLPFRLPSDEKLVSFLKQTGPLATTSANFADEPTVNTIKEAVELFGESIDFYVDGGDLSERKASRIVKIEADGSVKVIRN